MIPVARREFLRQVSLFCTAATVGGVSTTSAPALDPIQRNGESKFKFSLAAYSYRNLLQDGNSDFSLTDFIDDCARMQLEGTELTSYYFLEPVTHDTLRTLKQQCFRLGLDVSGTAVGNDFGFPPGDKRDQQIAHLKRWIEYAEILGAPVIRVFAGHVKGNSTPQETHQLIVSGLEECCEYAGQHGIFLALENHGGPTSTADGLLALARDVNSPWFGVNLDTGNFHSADIYGDLARVAPLAINVQVKVVVSGPDGQKRPTDFRRLARILREANYRGYIVLEYEEPADPREACPIYVEQLRDAFSS